MLNKLKIAIINYLVTHHEASFDELCKVFKLKKRMIYNYLDEINKILIFNRYNSIVFKKGSVSCYLEKEDLKYLVFNNPYSFSLDERVAFLCFDIIVFDRKNDLNKYANIFKMSKNSIINDFKVLKSFLKKYDLKLTFCHTDKYKIIGNELNIRKVLIKIIINFIYKKENNFIYNLLKINYKLSMLNLLKNVSKLLNNKVTNDYMEFLQIYLVILMLYYKKKNFITLKKEDKNNIKNIDEFNIAKSILKESKVNELYCDDELYYLSILLTCGNLTEAHNHLIANSMIFKKQINDFLTSIEETTYLFFNDKQNLTNDLYNHLIPSYYRIKFDLEIPCEYSNIIKEKYKNYFEITKNNIYVLENYWNIKFSDDEISFITLYLTSYIVSSKKLLEKNKILVVTNSGKSFSRMLKMELEKSFHNIEVDCVEQHELFDIYKEYDLVLSTIKLFKISYIKINNILTDDDKDKINKELVKIDLTKSKRNIYLSKIFFENHVNIFDENIDDWKKAIIKSSEPLLKENRINDQYVNSMIQVIEKNKKIVTLLDGIVIPHASPNDGVNNIGFTFNVFKQPFIFNGETQQKISIVIILAPFDSKSHIYPMTELIQQLNNKIVVENILNAKNKQEVYNYLLNIN